ncbi:MAG TPA: hypothetical protein P5270_00805 [Victivallales bacterium]|nr:hypothetical protein [Victivallales bacterium]HPO91534.1 hypothetical protein [Victivallales bacterium]HRR27879.1 hypothetical protein [Victivallales bacterium]HRU00535.1 hypothetical protein [Victivallales bacterium]
MYYKDLKIKLNEAKKKQIEQELKSHIAEKRNLITSAEKRLKQASELSQRADRRKYIFKMLSKVIVCVFLIFAFAIGMTKITFSILNRGKYIIQERTLQQEYLLSTDVSRKYPDLKNFIKNILSGELDNHFLRLSSDKETKDCITYLRSKNFEILSVEIDKNNNLYFVMCDFGENGYFYFRLKPGRKQSFDLISIEPFS